MSDVDVWIVTLAPPEAARARRIAATTDAERERASRFGKAADADRYLLAHGALRLLLARYLTCDPLSLRFIVDDHGKPHLDNEALEFNLSHSGDVALIAVARARRVGVDVEHIRPISDLGVVVRRLCSPDELAVLEGLAPAERERACFAIWTRKEALAKATGEGIAGIFRDASKHSRRDPDGWTTLQLDDVPGYAACVAAEGRGWEIVRRSVTDIDATR